MRDEIVICSLDDFVQSYLPFQPSSEDISYGKTTLITQGHLSLSDGWTAFPIPPSAQGQLDENKVFAPIKDIANSLRLAELAPSSMRPSKSTFIYDAMPNATIPSERIGNNHKVDGFLCMSVLSHNVAMSDLGVIFEYKKSSVKSEVVQNRRQIVSAASFLMNEDPRRLFTYGVTIEDTQVSVWYFSRSHSAKSKPFNFIKDPDMFITVLMSFMFATEASLGFDPNVKRLSVPLGDNKRRITYIYKFTDTRHSTEARYFATQETISEDHQLVITGRRIRVNTAKEILSGFDAPLQYLPNAPTVVLRDVWLDEGSKTEREIQDEIFGDLDKFRQRLASDSSEAPPHFSEFDDEMKAEITDILEKGKYKDYFLTISCESVGVTSKPVVANYFVDRNLHVPPEATLNTQTLHGTEPTRNTIDSRHISDTGLQEETNERGTPPRQYKPKTSYRLIYEEYCEDLNRESITSLHDTFAVLNDTLTCLILLYCAGWVHRDISCGNVLLWRDAQGRPHGKLGDLEYAKRFPSYDAGSSDPKTGTPYFMPVEIANGKYMSLVVPRDPYLGSSPQGRRGDPNLQVVHNFRHDVESLWWLTLWVLICRTGVVAGAERIFARDLSKGPVSRRDFFQTPEELWELLQPLEKDFRTFCLGLESPREYMHFAYVGQARQYHEIHKYSKTYWSMRDMFKAAIPDTAPPMTGGRVTIVKERMFSQVRKRSRPGDDEVPPSKRQREKSL